MVTWGRVPGDNQRLAPWPSTLASQYRPDSWKTPDAEFSRTELRRPYIFLSCRGDSSVQLRLGVTASPRLVVSTLRPHRNYLGNFHKQRHPDATGGDAEPPALGSAMFKNSPGDFPSHPGLRTVVGAGSISVTVFMQLLLGKALMERSESDPQ